MKDNFSTAFTHRRDKSGYTKKLLPVEAREGSWLKVSFEFDDEGPSKQEEKIKDLLVKLKKKPRQKIQGKGS